MADDVRARRAQRAREKTRRVALEPLQKYLVPGLLAILIVGGLVWAATHAPAGKKLAHEHAAFAWYVEGHPVSFRAGDYDCQTARLCDAVHMHFNPSSPETDQSDVLHVEGFFPDGVPDWNLGKIFSQYGLKLAPKDVTLDARDGHNGSTWREEGNHTWHVRVSKVVNGTRAAFVPIPGDWTTYVPRDMDKILLTYGDLTPAELDRQEQSIPDAGEWAGEGAKVPG